MGSATKTVKTQNILGQAMANPGMGKRVSTLVHQTDTKALVGGHGGRVVTLSPPTSAAGV